MRSLFNLAALTATLAAGAFLMPGVASDFDARDTTDPLDPLVGVEATEPSPVASASLPAPTLSPDELREATTPSAPPTPKLTPSTDVVRVITGEASWYGPGFYGNRTANGEVFQPGTMTAAHRTLPFGTKVRVTNLWNGRSAVIRINDRGPFIHHRVIDLGHGAASELGLIASGIAQVRLEVLR